MKGQIGAADKKRRAEQLRNLGHEKRRAFMEKFIKQELQVLLEGRIDKKTGYYKGFSKNYLPVAVMDGNPDLVGTLVPVMAYEIDERCMIGKIVHE